ncbi:hypothetical protein EON80_10285, partial [bacterium]
MNNKSSSTEQILRFLLLAFVGWFLIQNIFKPKTDTALPPRAALTLAQAFKGIDPAQGPLLTEVEALKEKEKLKADINKSPQDDLAYWSRLRQGLIDQYILGTLEVKERKSGFLGLGPVVKYFPVYDEIITHAKGDQIDAQALYQTGDLEWRQSIQKNALPSPESATALEALVHKGRSQSTFLDLDI